MSSPGRRVGEAVAVGSLGAALGGAVGSFVGLAIPATLVAGLNGVVSGWRGIYDWSRPTGPVAFVLDSTWGLPMTTASVFANAWARAQRDSGYVESLSRRRNRHVHRRGFVPRSGFAITLGNVIGGAGDVDQPRRRRLITDHEDVHCWQARWLGPFFPLVYLGWSASGAVVGVGVWLFARRSEPIGKVVETAAYYLNPLEWWAYSRDDHWPPGGKVVGMGWAAPCCRPLSVVRAERGAR